MIEKITFGDLSLSYHFKYASKLPFFMDNKEISFKPGLNIIYAPNGTGKSTILSILAKSTASEQGGVSTLTQHWFHDIFNRDENRMGEIKVAHDGQPVVYINSRNAIGLIGGGAAFDDDFFKEGFTETKLHESSGFTTMHRLKKAMAILCGEEKIADSYNMKNFYSSDKDKRHEVFLMPSIALGQKTILLDEPESGLAIHAQSNLWNIIDKGAKEQNIQVIAATHSPFSLACDANFIELSPDYINIAKEKILTLALQLNIMQKIKETQGG